MTALPKKSGLDRLKRLGETSFSMKMLSVVIHPNTRHSMTRPTRAVFLKMIRLVLAKAS